MKAVVFGGGIAGLLTTLQLMKCEKISEIFLIENEKKLGGLLGSDDFGKIKVDRGTHLLSATDCTEINQILGLFPGKVMKEVTIRNGHAIRGVVYKKQFLESKSILTNADSIIARQLQNNSKDPNITECSHGEKFGSLLNEKLFIQAISRFTNVSKSEVSLLDESIFVAAGLKRIFLTNKTLNEHLKRNCEYCDELLASNRTPRKEKILYPKTGGMETFILNIKKRLLKNKKVKIKLNCRAKSFNFSGNKILSFSTADGEKDIPVDLVFWSAPAQIFGNIIGEKVNAKPRFNEICILHLSGKGKILTDLSYFYQHDGLGWRFTLYNNFRTDIPTEEILIGVEIVGGPLLTEALMINNLIYQVRKELVELKIVDKSFDVEKYKILRVSNGFPIILQKDNKLIQRYSEHLENKFLNLAFVGRQAGKALFMRDVLKDTFKKVNKLLNEKNS